MSFFSLSNGADSSVLLRERAIGSQLDADFEKTVIEFSMKRDTLLGYSPKW